MTATAGAGLFATAEAAADPAAAATSTLAKGTRLRLTAEAAPMPDGTRVLAVTVIGGTATGYVRATAVAPRDSAGARRLDPGPGRDRSRRTPTGPTTRWWWPSRVSEVAAVSLVVKNAAGTTVRSVSISGDIARFAWDMRTSAGKLVPDGDYAWTLRARDSWGNPTASRTGSFTVDGTPPVTRASTAATAGRAAGA